MAAVYLPDPEELGRRRFPDNKGFRNNLRLTSNDILTQLQSLLASNYPKEVSTNVGVYYKTMAREIARLNMSMGAINLDKTYTSTRIQYLQQILGERLFLTDKIAPANYNDETYRDYLISIKDAYLRGSQKESIELLASKFTGQRINLRELYLEAREPFSSLDVTDTHSMVVEVFVDNLLRAGYNINALQQDLDFFVNLVRPAHVLYDTKLIWTERFDINSISDIFGDTGGGCIPSYDYISFEEPTVLALLIFVLPDGEYATGLIDSIHHEDLIFYLDDATRVITEPGVDGTKIFDVHGRRISFNDLRVGQYVRIVSQVIPGSFQFWWTPSMLLPTWSSQFYRSVYRRPLFQETVKKVMDAHGRFPLQIKSTPTTVCDRWVQDVLQPMYEDMRHTCSKGHSQQAVHSVMIRERMGQPRFGWPYPRQEIYDPILLGDDFIFWVNHAPLTDGSNNPATPSDIVVRIDGTAIPNAVINVIPDSGRLGLQEGTDFWDTTAHKILRPGDEINFSYHYLKDGTNIDATTSSAYGISFWQLPKVPVVQNPTTGDLADTSNLTVSVDGTAITDAVVSLLPLMGHVILQQSSDFWKASELHRIPTPYNTWVDATTAVVDSTTVRVSGHWVGDMLEIGYSWGEHYQYSAVFDDPGRVFDGYVSSLQTYGLVFDGETGLDPEVAAVPTDEPITVGYRYRGYLLHHSSVLNSSDTLKLNDYQKPVTRASIINQQSSLNHYNKFFSAEFLYDSSGVPVLDDKYLENGLDPVVKLLEGTPTFQETFAYQPHMIYSRKLQDIRTNHKLLLYSDLLLKEFNSSAQHVPLSSICDSERVTFKIRLGNDDIPHLRECAPWELFDTVYFKDVDISIPGEHRGIPNLRIDTVYLRENFILRGMGETGTATYTYSFDTPTNINEFNLPTNFKYAYGDDLIDFPTLPVINETGGLAGPSDVTALVDGYPYTVVDLDPVTGWIKLDAFSGPIRYVHVQLTYRIRNHVRVSIVDHVQSRIMDDIYVFGGLCYDQEAVVLGVKYNEYFTFLDDFSDGIKISFFNKDTKQVEDHVFSGPVFEYYDTSLDEIGVPENFPNALVRLYNPMQVKNPLNYSAEYGFMLDQLVRFRKKTFKELLPNRTFRTLQLTEMLPI